MKWSGYHSHPAEWQTPTPTPASWTARSSPASDLKICFQNLLQVESWTSHKQQLQIVDGMRKSLKDSDTDTAPLLSQNIFSLIWGGN